LLVVRPVSLGEVRTKDNVPYIKTLDTGGEFVITTQRYGFIGPLKSVQQKLSAIEQIERKENALAIKRSSRKTPEYFIGLDALLAEAVLNGVRRVQ
jgi:hypothetical protein